MSNEEVTTGIESTETGQAETDPVTGRTVEAPKTEAVEKPEVQETAGQPEEGTGEDSDDSFFNPEDIKDKPELMAAYKQMQKAFTKKMQTIKTERQKIEAFDAFQADPVGQMQAMAERMGYKMTRAQAAAELNHQQEQNNFEPQSWEDVFSAMEKRVEAKMAQRYAPVINQVTQMRKQSIENMLDESVPDWRTYEDEMRENLQRYPGMVNDPLTLYRISVPPEVLESRATQKALKKMEDKVKGAKTSGISSKKTSSDAGMPDGPVSFQQAVEIAKAKLAQDGIVKH